MKWAITVTVPSYGSRARNNGFKLQYAEVTKTDNSLTIGEFDSPVISEKGSWPDIHDFSGETALIQPGSKPQLAVRFTIEQIEEYLFVTTAFPIKHTVALYNIKGVKKAVSTQSHASRKVLSVKGFPTGLYIIKIKHGHQTIRKTLMLY